MNSEFIALLEREFRSLEAKGQGPFATVQAQAEKIEHLDQSYLSKLRSGERALTRKKARQIAESLKQGASPEEINQFQEELLSASHSPTKFLISIQEWFKARSREKSLMLVDYREFPVVRPRGGRALLARIVGEAVADGLHFAMVRPFPDISILAGKVPLPQLRFLSMLQEHLTETYLSILECALDKAQEEEPDHQAGAKENSDKLKDRLDEVCQRIKLYYLDNVESASSLGIGYRVFYTETHESAGAASVSTEVQNGCLWEWVSSPNDDHMVPKDHHSPEERSSTIQATSFGYFPIIDYWRQKSRLPQNSKELLDFANNLEKDCLFLSRHGLKNGEKKWSVMSAPEGIISRHLSKKS